MTTFVDDDAPVRDNIAVLSTASTVVENEYARSLEEMIFEVTTQALLDAGLSIDDLDGVVLSGNDQIDGRVISCMTSAGPAGGVEKDTTMIASSSDHALVYGYLRLRSGQGKNVMVVGWAKPSESVDPGHAELVAAEPFLLRGIGMNNTVAAALQASTWTTVEEAPTSDLLAWPLTTKDVPRQADSVHAAILAVEGSFPENSELAWIVDAGWATDSYELGSRDLANLTALQVAAEQIARRDTTVAPTQWNSIEIAGISQPSVARSVELLALDRGIDVNASGSLHDVPTSPHVAGLSRMIAAIRSIADHRSAEGDSSRRRLAGGVGLHGFAGQGATVMVFSNTKGGNA